MTPLLAALSPTTWIILGIVAVLIFGRRLPEIARVLGKNITELMQGAHGLGQPYSLGEWICLALLAIAIAVGLFVFLVLGGLWRP